MKAERHIAMTPMAHDGTRGDWLDVPGLYYLLNTVTILLDRPLDAQRLIV
jgi:hypothetical protein